MALNQQKSTKIQITRSATILFGLIDPDLTINNYNEKHANLKPDTAVTADLIAKKSLKQLHLHLKTIGWNLHKSSFPGDFDNEEERYWTITKIADKKSGGVVLRSALNTDPWSMPPEMKINCSINPETGVTTTTSSPALENGGAFPTPPSLPKDASWFSSIHMSKLPEQMDGEWAWAFDPPKKK